MPHGVPNTLASIQERLLLDDRGYETPCLVWPDALSQGYGKVSYRARVWRVHRLLYIELVDTIPPSLEIDHLCKVRACANVAHLEPVTHEMNVLRGDSPLALHARKTHCVHGHEFVGDNVIPIFRNGRPGRECRACRDRRNAVGSAQRRLLRLAG